MVENAQVQKHQHFFKKVLILKLENQIKCKLLPRFTVLLVVKVK